MGNYACCQQKKKDYNYKYTQQNLNNSLSKRRESHNNPYNLPNYQPNNDKKDYKFSSNLYNQKPQDVKINQIYRSQKQQQNNKTYHKEEQKGSVKYEESRYTIVDMITPKQGKEQNVHHSKKTFRERQMQVEIYQPQKHHNGVLKEPVAEIPVVSSLISKRLKQEKFFQSRFGRNLQVKNYAGQIYHGQINHTTKLPHGFGKMYKKDGSLFIGEFTNGSANEQGAIIFEDGSYLKGLFHENAANGLGYFQSQNFKYTGPFKHNLFHGKQAKQIGPDYQFEGEYIQGHKLLGNLSWRNEAGLYVYNGMFNQNDQFHGLGLLTEPDGLYEGYFANGKRQGRGQYKFSNGLTYKGLYSNNLKHGKGILYNNDNSIAYSGQFENGLPHGQGQSPQHGKLIKKRWVYGIDSELL